MSEDNFMLVQRLFRVATDKNIKISFAESCTGGLLGASVTEMAGASEFFLGSAVTYSNEAKKDILGVNKTTLKKYGAVSAECAEEMAVGARKIYKSDIAVSTTGIAGPAGGSEEKPVGTVWFGYASEGKTTSFMRVFKGDRNKIREAALRQVLFFLLEELSADEK